MNSELTEEFIVLFRDLPENIKALAAKNYKLWKNNPSHPGLNFKRIKSSKDIYSIRIGLGYRAIGVVKNKDTIIWFWVGTHSKYDALMKNI